MKLQIKTLSPIHIGNGEKYNGLSYIEDIKSHQIFIIEFEKIKKILNQKEIESFMDWVLTEKDPSWFKFCKYKLNSPQLQNEFKKSALYRLDNYSHEKLRDIECFIKQNNKLYLPGTEIKGAIRTAVTYYLLKKENYWNWLKEQLDEFDSAHKGDLKKIAGQKGRWVNDIKKRLVNKMSEIEKKLQNQLFIAGKINDSKYDLFKFLHISDSELKEPYQCLFISSLKTLNINREFNIFQELCKNGQNFICDFKLENNPLILNKLGFNDEQKWVISDIKNIFQCCYEFSDRLLKEEINYTHYPKEVKNKLNQIKELNSKDSPIIRIGKNEGYLSVTVGLLVKDKDKNLYDNVLSHATKNTSYPGEFPKTRRIVNLLNGGYDTLGWAKMNIIN